MSEGDIRKSIRPIAPTKFDSTKGFAKSFGGQKMVPDQETSDIIMFEYCETVGGFNFCYILDEKGKPIDPVVNMKQSLEKVKKRRGSIMPEKSEWFDVDDDNIGNIRKRGYFGKDGIDIGYKACYNGDDGFIVMSPESFEEEFGTDIER